MLVFLAFGGERFEEQALLTWAALQSLYYALPAFLAWNLLSAIISASAEISRKGKWIGTRFVFHKPQHIFTTQFHPDDDGATIPFPVREAEPNTFVQFDLKHHGGRGIASIGPYTMPIHGFAVSRDINYGARIDAKRRAHLSINCPNNSDPTTVYIYAVSWEP